QLLSQPLHSPPFPTRRSSDLIEASACFTTWISLELNRSSLPGNRDALIILSGPWARRPVFCFLNSSGSEFWSPSSTPATVHSRRAKSFRLIPLFGPNSIAPSIVLRPWQEHGWPRIGKIGMLYSLGHFTP